MPGIAAYAAHSKFGLIERLRESLAVELAQRTEGNSILPRRHFDTPMAEPPIGPAEGRPFVGETYLHALKRIDTRGDRPLPCCISRPMLRPS